MPSRVADILMQEGANAARAREASGAIWGGAVQNLAQIPQQLQQQAAQRQQQDQLAQERQQRLQIGQAQLDDLQHDKLGEALTAQLVHQNTSMDDASGHQTTNWDQVADGLTAKGFLKHAQHARDFGVQDEQRRNDVQNAHLAFVQKQRQYYADTIGGILSASADDQPTLYATARGTLKAAAKNDPFVDALPAAYPGADSLKALHQSLQTDAQRAQQFKEAAAERAKNLKEVPPGGKLVQIDPETGQATTVAEGGPPADAAEHARHDQAMEQIDKMRLGREAAAQSELARHHRALEQNEKLTKVEHLDPATGKTVIEWLPQSQIKGQTFQKGVGATVESRLASAQAVNQTGEDIIKKLGDPAYASKVGPAMGRYSSMRDFIGNPPPEFAELAGTIESYSLANMGVHGMRSAQGAEQIKKLLDQKHTPESLIATIKGLNQFSTHFMANEGRVTGGPASNTSRVYYDANGNPIKQ